MADSTFAYDTTAKVKRDTNWMMVLFLLHVHVLGILGLYYIIFEAYFTTTLFGKLSNLKFYLLKDIHI